MHLSGEDVAVEEPTMDEGDDLEVLGEQLYDLIYHRHAEMAGKLTGEVTEEANPSGCHTAKRMDDTPKPKQCICSHHLPLPLKWSYDVNVTSQSPPKETRQKPHRQL